MRAELVALVLAGAASSVPAEGTAQGRLLLQAGGASAFPEAEVVSDAAFYGMGGVGADWTGDRGLAFASVMGGLASDDATGADFVSALAGLEFWSGGGSAVGLAGRATGFRVRTPFTYRTLALRGGPAVRLRRGAFTAVLRGELGGGTSLVELRRGDRRRRAERDLWSRGTELEFSWDTGRWATEVSGGSWDSDGGPFRRAGGALTVGGHRWALRLDAAAWDTPAGSDWSAGTALLLPVGGRATVTASAGRAAPDPLTLVDAGGQAGVLASWTVAAFGGPPPPLVELRDDARGRTARFRLTHDRARAAERVEVLGDFTAWVATPLHRAGDGWEAELPVAPGVHHFGFLVDGEWWVPEGRSGNVPDEWGRTNATLVVPGPADGGWS